MSHDIFDEIDKEILKILSQDGRTKFTTIAKKINRTEGTVRNRVRRLKEKGIIQGFKVITDPVNLGYERQAIVRFELTPKYEVYTQLSHLPFVCSSSDCQLLSLYRSNGESTFILEIQSKSEKGLDHFLEALSEFDGLSDMEVLVKEEKLYSNVA